MNHLVINHTAWSGSFLSEIESVSGKERRNRASRRPTFKSRCFRTLETTQSAPQDQPDAREMDDAIHPLSSSDILPLIFAQLPPDQILYAASLVCREWRRVARTDSLWRGLLARATDGKDPVVQPPGGASGSWFRLATTSRLARILLGLAAHPSAASPAHLYPVLSRNRDPLLWSLYPARLCFSGTFEQWASSVLMDVDPGPAANAAAANILSANPAFPALQPPLVHIYRAELLLRAIHGRRFEGYSLYPSANRRDALPSITRIEGEVQPDGRVSYRELEILRNRGPHPIMLPASGVVCYESHPAIYYDSPAATVDQEITFTVDLPPLLTEPSSIKLFRPFGEKFGMAWEVDWEDGRERGRSEFLLAD